MSIKVLQIHPTYAAVGMSHHFTNGHRSAAERGASIPVKFDRREGYSQTEEVAWPTRFKEDATREHE